MTDTEVLMVTDKLPPVTVSGYRGIVMLQKSGEDSEVRWFEYRPAFDQDIVKIEWNLDTMSILLPIEAANVLIKRGWARDMTSKEALAYNDRHKKTEVDEPPKSKKKEIDK